MYNAVLNKIFDTFFKDSEFAVLDSLKENWIAVLLGAAVFTVITIICVILYKKKKQAVSQEEAIYINNIKNKKPLFNVRSISFAAMCLALAFVLSYIKIFELPQGGAITPASMMPVILYAYIYGPKRGFAVSFIFFLMQLLQGPYILNPVQFFFDYIFAFTIIGVAGFFKRSLLLGTVTAHLLRYISHVIAAFAFFREYNQTGINDTAYCLIYNSFVIIELIVCIIIEIIPPVKSGLDRISCDLRKSVR